MVRIHDMAFAVVLRIWTKQLIPYIHLTALHSVELLLDNLAKFLGGR